VCTGTDADADTEVEADADAEAEVDAELSAGNPPGGLFAPSTVGMVGMVGMVGCRPLARSTCLIFSNTLSSPKSVTQSRLQPNTPHTMDGRAAPAPSSITVLPSRIDVSRIVR
jgi:hypothetical protein